MAARPLFGTDGIRGCFNVRPLTPDCLHTLGFAIGRMLAGRPERPKVVIGRDTRDSGPLITLSLSSGLMMAGVDVLDAGVLTTPGVAFLTTHVRMSAGIVVSASHNPAAENGIKIFDAMGFKLTCAEESEIERLIREITPSPAPRLGRFHAAAELAGLYAHSLIDAPDFRDSPLAGTRVLLDCANGAASAFAAPCFVGLGAQPIVIHNHPTGDNINFQCGSEHVRRNPGALAELIRYYRADYGIAFDGDADRCVFVTPEGSLIDGDHLLAFLAGELKQAGRLTHNTVVASVMSNSGLQRYLDAIGVIRRSAPVGDRLVVEDMRTHGYVLGGEQAGHVVILDGARTTGDALYIALLISTIARRKGDLHLSALASLIEKFPQVIASARVRQQPDLAGLVDLEAFRRQEGLNMRYSGTEPLFRAMVEGQKGESLLDVADVARRICRVVQRAADSDGEAIEVLNCTTGEVLDVSGASGG